MAEIRIYVERRREERYHSEYLFVRRRLRDLEPWATESGINFL